MLDKSDWTKIFIGALLLVVIIVVLLNFMKTQIPYTDKVCTNVQVPYSEKSCQNVQVPITAKNCQPYAFDIVTEKCEYTYSSSKHVNINEVICKLNNFERASGNFMITYGFTYKTQDPHYSGGTLDVRKVKTTSLWVSALGTQTVYSTLETERAYDPFNIYSKIYSNEVYCVCEASPPQNQYCQDVTQYKTEQNCQYITIYKTEQQCQDTVKYKTVSLWQSLMGTGDAQVQHDIRASTNLTQSTSITPAITIITTIRTPTPTPIPTIKHKITDGFWCRQTSVNIDKALTAVVECYQFFSDGTYKWGYSPGWAMGKSPSCSGDPNVKCEYSINSKGQYEIQGGSTFTLSGDTLTNPHDNPPFILSSTGIP